MPTRTLPTRDVTLADGRRLYYQQEESRRCAEAGKATAVYMTKRGPDGALRILITVDDEPERGEHYHLSGSYSTRTPTPDEMVAALRALIPGGGHFGVMTPERNPKALHGHVVHLSEETPRYLARHAAADADKPPEVYAHSVGSPTRTDAPDTENRVPLAERLEHLRIDLGLVPPFTSDELREALDQVRARRGLAPGAPPPYSCTEQRGKDVIIPYPSNLPPSEQEHAQWHGIAHLILEHQQLATGVYSLKQERDAEAWADAMMTYVICGDTDDDADAADEEG
jgi:hypothetical protein